MLPSERINDPQEALRLALQGWQAGLYTALPGIVQGFDGATRVSVQPAIRAYIRNAQGQFNWVDYPLLTDVCVWFPRAGGFSITYPISPGDEALLIFSNRCLDSWWESGGVQNQSELRMHDLSDGIALVGLSSKPRALSSISTNSLQMRSDDGSCYVEVKTGHVVNIVAPGGINLTAGAVQMQLNPTSGKITMTAPTEIDLVTPVTDISGSIAGGTAGGSPTATFHGSVTATGEGTFNGGHTVSQHTHTQNPDSHGDTEAPTNTPTG